MSLETLAVRRKVDMQALLRKRDSRVKLHQTKITS
jgi:hypothetical protein